MQLLRVGFDEVVSIMDEDDMCVIAVADGHCIIKPEYDFKDRILLIMKKDITQDP